MNVGTDFDPKEHNVKNWRPLEVFKNKASMKNWFQIPYSDKLTWESWLKKH